MHPCFILGINARCGTNYLYNLLELHPQISGTDLLSEDFLVHYSPDTPRKVHALFSHYRSHPDWNVEGDVCTEQEFIERYMNGGWMNFLSAACGEPPRTDQHLLTKTPSVHNIGNFFKLFPETKLIILIRDGRAVAESGVRSFSHSYEVLIRRWARAAREILRFRQENEGADFIITKYEDLCLNTETELKHIFIFLGLEADNYDFEAARNLRVTGSSETRGNKASVEWQPKKKWSGFNPTKRFEHWGRWRHERFNWAAGREMVALGYELKPSGLPNIITWPMNVLLDLIGVTRVFYLPRMVHLVRKRSRR